MTLVAGCVLSPLLELHIKCCYKIFSEMEATVNKIEIQNGGFGGQSFQLFHEIDKISSINNIYECYM